MTFVGPRDISRIGVVSQRNDHLQEKPYNHKSCEQSGTSGWPQRCKTGGRKGGRAPELTRPVRGKK